MLQFITAIKQIRHKKFFFILMLFLMTVSIFLVSILIYLYITSYNDLKLIKKQFPVRLTLSYNTKAITPPDDRIRIPYEILNHSDFFEAVDSNLYLSATIESHLRLPNEHDNKKMLEEEFFFQGILHSIKEYNSGYIVSISVTNNLWGELDSGKEYKFYLQTNKSLRELNLLLDKELYLLGVYNGVQYTLSNTSIDTTIPVDEDNLSILQLAEYYRYMGLLESRITSQFSYPLLYTQDIKTYEPFLNSTYQLVEGNIFTLENYQMNQQVCLIPLDFAKRFNYTVGDTIPINEIGVHVSSNIHSPHNYSCGPFTNEYTSVHLSYLMNGVIDKEQALHSENGIGNLDSLNQILDMYKVTYKEYLHSDAKDYKIVGIYNKNGYGENPYYYMNPNTIILPSSIKMKDSSLDEFLFPHYRLNSLTFTFKDQDKKDEFYHYLSMQNFDFSTYNIAIHDNGYYELKDIISSIQDAASLLLIISFLAFFILLILFMYFYFESAKHIYLLNRILGNNKKMSKHSIGYVTHIIFICSIVMTILGNIISIEKLIQVFYDNTIKNTVSNNTSTINVYEVIDYSWNINYLPYIVISLCMIYLFIYLIFSKLYTNKPLIQLISDK